MGDRREHARPVQWANAIVGSEPHPLAGCADLGCRYDEWPWVVETWIVPDERTDALEAYMLGRYGAGYDLRMKRTQLPDGTWRYVLTRWHSAD